MKRVWLVIATVLILPPTAVAHDAILPDADDSSGRLDIKSVEISHPDSGTIRFVVSFYEPHSFTPGDEYQGADEVRISLRVDGRAPWHFKNIVLRGNPDGGLYGVLRNHNGRERSYVRAWRPDDVSLAVDVKRSQLKKTRLAHRADWLVFTYYLDHETFACADEAGDVPSVCRDSAPHSRFERHDL